MRAYRRSDTLLEGTIRHLSDSYEPDAIGGGAYLLDLGKARILASIDALRWIDERMEADHG